MCTGICSDAPMNFAFATMLLSHAPPSACCAHMAFANNNRVNNPTAHRWARA